MTTHDHSERIRLQAERVVRAYKEMRDTTNSANLKSDDSPVGLFAELMQQIRMLEGWLEPRPDLHAETVAELREDREPPSSQSGDPLATRKRPNGPRRCRAASRASAGG